MRRAHLALAAAAAALVVGLVACPDRVTNSPSGVASAIPPLPECETAAIDVGGHPVTVEIADNGPRRQYGLMFRDVLPDDRGMLFLFPYPKNLGFWMRNCPHDLDIAYLSDAGQILKFERMKAFEEHGGYSSPGPVRIALEMRAGWFEAHGVKPMSWVKMPVELLTRRGEPDDDDTEQIRRILTPGSPRPPGDVPPAGH